MQNTSVILVSTTQQPAPGQNLSMPVDSLVLTGVVFFGTVLSNMLGWMATRAVASAEQRITQNAGLISKLMDEHHALEKKIAEEYISRPELTHRFSLIDAHIERLGSQVQEGTVILKSLETTITERFRERPY
jgi:D-ribose pyranose/furanose isomerase RbsD